MKFDKKKFWELLSGQCCSLKLLFLTLTKFGNHCSHAAEPVSQAEVINKLHQTWYG